MVCAAAGKNSCCQWCGMCYYSPVSYELREYIEGSVSPFAKWFRGLSAVAAARVDRYLRRLEQGNFGNCRSVGGGVYEVRVDYGPGYRVYYGEDQGRWIILLGGGDKRRQSQDIGVAIDRWRAYKQRRS